jgi:hypothetical protein
MIVNMEIEFIKILWLLKCTIQFLKAYSKFWKNKLAEKTPIVSNTISN